MKRIIELFDAIVEASTPEDCTAQDIVRFYFILVLLLVGLMVFLSIFNFIISL